MTHSRYLNAMADDLRDYVELQRSVAVGDERNRVARDLHDTVKQKLFALSLQIATAKARLAQDAIESGALEEAALITAEAQHDVMGLINKLSGSLVEDSSFTTQLLGLAEDCRRRFGIAVSLEPSSQLSVTAETGSQLLLIIQEAVTNAVRHGKADRIGIRFATPTRGHELIISDNGSGFECETVAKGLGMSSMSQRAATLPQGRIRWQRGETSGTAVIIGWADGAQR